MTPASLSLEQAPPISVPLRFFLTAPLFAVLAALLLLVSGPEVLLSRWGPATLALTHLLTLGFLGLVMCGAMMQMLPVLAGSTIPAVEAVSAVVHVLLSCAIAALAAGFLWGRDFLIEAAVGGLGAGFILFAVSLAVALARVRRSNPTVTGMRLALSALVITAALGILLGSNLARPFGLDHPLLFTDIHLGWGLLGWVGLLVTGVAYQVVPMFQMTPDYPHWMTRMLTRMLFAALVIWTFLLLADATRAVRGSLASWWLALPAAGYCLFAITTLRLQQRRKRRVPDVTLLFWRTGMVAVLVCVALWVAGLLSGLGDRVEYPLLLGGGLIYGFAVSVVNGMLYKIVPFLSWFHLQHYKVNVLGGGGAKVPNMKEFISDRLAKRQFLLHLGALAMAGPAILFPEWLARPAGLIFGISAALLWYNLLQAVLRYRSVARSLNAAGQGTGTASA